MDIGELVAKIQDNLKSVVGERSIRIHIEDFTEKNSKPSYIEFKLPDKEHEEAAVQLYDRLSRLVKNNYPRVHISYNNPHFHHQDSYIRRIVIKIDEIVRKPTEKQALLKDVALNFNRILKMCRKYGAKK